jgi:hypothetical protein
METKQTLIDKATVNAGFFRVLDASESKQLIAFDEAIKIAERLLKTNRHNYRDNILVSWTPAEPSQLEVIATNAYAWVAITVRNTVELYREKETFLRYENGQLVETTAAKDLEVIRYKDTSLKNIERDEFLVFEVNKQALNHKKPYLDLFEHRGIIFINHYAVAEFSGEAIPLQRHYNAKYMAPILGSLSEKLTLGIAKNDLKNILFLQDKEKRILFFICSCLNPDFKKEITKI